MGDPSGSKHHFWIGEEGCVPVPVPRGKGVPHHGMGYVISLHLFYYISFLCSSSLLLQKKNGTQTISGQKQIYCCTKNPSGQTIIVYPTSLLILLWKWPEQISGSCGNLALVPVTFCLPYGPSLKWVLVFLVKKEVQPFIHLWILCLTLT